MSIRTLLLASVLMMLVLSSACGSPICGDARLEGREQCDDGNLESGDGCSSTCTFDEACTDQLDNDGDGAVDCADSGCATHSSCTAICAAPLTAVDPSVVQGTTAGSPDFALSTCQMEFGGFDGPDVVYEIVPENDVLELVLSSDHDHGLDVRAACDSNESSLGCTDAFFGGFDERLTVEVTPGEPVYVLVGAFSAGDDGPFTLSIASRAYVCGDGLLEADEQCDDSNLEMGDGCDDTCRFELVCGDSFIASIDLGGNEECDDGNNTPGDGCDDTCQVEATPEIEPNEDGTPEPGGQGADGNDFDPQGAQGPYTADIILSAALEPAGDEDIFLIQNPGAYSTSVRLDTYKPGIGFGLSCGHAIDTVISVRESAGLLIDRNVDREPNQDECSGLDLRLPSGTQAFVHLTTFDDETALDAYFLAMDFATCGDGVREGLESCDDGNNTPGDGCDADCMIE